MGHASPTSTTMAVCYDDSTMLSAFGEDRVRIHFLIGGNLVCARRPMSKPLMSCPTLEASFSKFRGLLGSMIEKRWHVDFVVIALINLLVEYLFFIVGFGFQHWFYSFPNWCQDGSSGIDFTERATTDDYSSCKQECIFFILILVHLIYISDVFGHFDVYMCLGTF